MQVIDVIRPAHDVDHRTVDAAEPTVDVARRAIDPACSPIGLGATTMDLACPTIALPARRTVSLARRSTPAGSSNGPACRAIGLADFGDSLAKRIIRLNNMLFGPQQNVKKSPRYRTQCSFECGFVAIVRTVTTFVPTLVPLVRARRR